MTNEAHLPDLSLERMHPAPVAGVDEAGRGPLAGPVVAAAVIIPDGLSIPGIDDSKKMTAKKRELLYTHITQQCSHGVGIASVAEIDSINILQASLLAMQRAVAHLPHTPNAILVDGNKIPALMPCPAYPVIKGDSISLSIAAASIIAKVTRDRIMQELDKAHPAYGFARHAGYGTAAHLLALQTHGATLISKSMQGRN